MKVLLLIDSLGSGGAERSTAVVLPHLRRRGLDVSVVTLYRAIDGSEDDVRASEFSVHTLRSKRFLGRVRELRRHLRQERPDILHTSLFSSDQLGRIAAAGLRTKVVSSLVSAPRSATGERSGGPPPWKIKTVNAIDIVTSHLFVDRFHAVSKGVAEAYSKQYHLKPGRVSVVERGRQEDELGRRSAQRRAAVRESLGIDSHAEVVVAAGRHDFQKAHVDLIRAVALLAADRPNVLLLIAGRDGDQTNEMKAMIAASDGLDAHVRLLGYRSDVADLLAASDVMALSSRNEGTAGVALEAMGVGTPIVSTRLAGLEGILVNDHNALIVSVGAPGEMADAIGRVLDEPELAERLAAAGRNDFLTRFTIDRAADGMVALYRDVAGLTTQKRRSMVCPKPAEEL